MKLANNNLYQGFILPGVPGAKTIDGVVIRIESSDIMKLLDNRTPFSVLLKCILKPGTAPTYNAATTLEFAKNRQHGFKHLPYPVTLNSEIPWMDGGVYLLTCYGSYNTLLPISTLHQVTQTEKLITFGTDITVKGQLKTYSQVVSMLTNLANEALTLDENDNLVIPGDVVGLNNSISFSSIKESLTNISSSISTQSQNITNLSSGLKKLQDYIDTVKDSIESALSVDSDGNIKAHDVLFDGNTNTYVSLYEFYKDIEPNIEIMSNIGDVIDELDNRVTIIDNWMNDGTLVKSFNALKAEWNAIAWDDFVKFTTNRDIQSPKDFIFDASQVKLMTVLNLKDPFESSDKFVPANSSATLLEGSSKYQYAFFIDLVYGNTPNLAVEVKTASTDTKVINIPTSTFPKSTFGFYVVRTGTDYVHCIARYAEDMADNTYNKWFSVPLTTNLNDALIIKVKAVNPTNNLQRVYAYRADVLDTSKDFCYDITLSNAQSLKDALNLIIRNTHSRIKELEAELSITTTRMNSVMTSMLNLNTELTTVQTNITSLQTSVSSLETGLSTANTNIATVSSDLTAHKASDSHLTEDQKTKLLHIPLKGVSMISIPSNSNGYGWYNIGDFYCIYGNSCEFCVTYGTNSFTIILASYTYDVADSSVSGYSSDPTDPAHYNYHVVVKAEGINTINIHIDHPHPHAFQVSCYIDAISLQTLQDYGYLTCYCKDRSGSANLYKISGSKTSNCTTGTSFIRKVAKLQRPDLVEQISATAAGGRVLSVAGVGISWYTHYNNSNTYPAIQKHESSLFESEVYLISYIHRNEGGTRKYYGSFLFDKGKFVSVGGHGFIGWSENNYVLEKPSTTTMIYEGFYAVKGESNETDDYTRWTLFFWCADTSHPVEIIIRKIRNPW